jgi:hypothetical protein
MQTLSIKRQAKRLDHAAYDAGLRSMVELKLNP